MSDVERVYRELSAVRALLQAQGEASDVVAFEELAAKTLVLCAASFFERKICSSLLQTARDTGASVLFCTFIEKQALERKFHSLFDWERSNANKFFGLFGEEMRNWLRRLVEEDDNLTRSVREFMFINSQRNRLVHGNFAATSAEVTFEEVWQKYQTAFIFTDWLPVRLSEAARAGGVPEVVAQQAPN